MLCCAKARHALPQVTTAGQASVLQLLGEEIDHVGQLYNSCCAVPEGLL
jgi:hypothetical protein